MNESEKIIKNKKISETKHNTISRHNEMDCKTFTIKIQKIL